MNSIKPKQRFIYCTLIMIGLAYICYMMVISTNLQSINTLKGECQTLDNELAELESYVVHRDIYLRQINTNNESIEKMVDSFLPKINNQNFIAYADYLDNEFDMSTSVFAFDSDTEETPLDYIFDADRDETILMSRNASLTYSIKYKDLKRYLEEIKESDMNMSLISITASLDSSTNLLTGTITLNSKAVSSSNKKNEMYNTEEIHTGVDNIFGEYTEGVPSIY